MWMSVSCYVLGCNDHGMRGSVRSVQHARFGRVTACAAHDPNRFGVGLPFAGLHDRPLQALRAPESPTTDDGGAYVPIVSTPHPKSPVGDKIAIPF